MLRRILDRKLLVLVIVALPIFSLAVILLSLISSFSLLPFSNAGHYPSLTEKHQGVQVNLFAEGLSHPTSMAFIDNDTLLVLEKDTGYIRKITNGILEKEPLLRLNIDSTAERGLLGIAVLREERRESTDVNTSLSNDHNSSGSSTSLELSSTSPPLTSSISSEKCCHYSVFISFTQKNNSTKLSKIVALDNLSEGHKDTKGNNFGNRGSLRNVIYKYDWDGKSLSNPELLLVLPAEPGPYHNGGKLKIGPDNQLYAVIGDLTSPNSILQNHPQSINDNDTNLASSLISNSSIVVRIDPYSGLPSNDNIFVSHSKNKTQPEIERGGQGMDYIYAYGIRNSFGLAFDPLTGRLWDTENGEDEYDEINIVNPSFNSGWHQIMGPSSRNPNFTDSDLILLNGSYYYSDPIFSWKKPIGVTDLEFFNSSKLGVEYKNNLFVGDINKGNLYYFKVSGDRSGLNFEEVPGIKDDLVADNKEEVDAVTFATGFGGITDIETGPDGALYILTYLDGRIYRITEDH